MKKLIIYFIVFYVIVITCLIITNTCIKKETKKIENIIIKSPGYNTKTDLIIKSLLNTKPILTEVANLEWKTAYTIRYNEYELFIVHNKHIPYKQRESWSYYCCDVNGNIIPIQTSYNIEQHKISDNTYKLIRDYCKKLQTKTKQNENI